METINLAEFQRIATPQLLQIMAEQNFEYGFYSHADSFVQHLMREYPLLVKEWLKALFLAYFNDEKIVVELLHIISHLKYQDIFPQGPTMALAALKHIDFQVRECAIRAYENWGDYGALSILRNLQYEEKWLQEYLNQVILDLEALKEKEKVLC